MIRQGKDKDEALRLLTQKLSDSMSTIREAGLQKKDLQKQIDDGLIKIVGI